MARAVPHDPSPPPFPFAPGTLLAGKYRVERVIGQGGMGIVLEARHVGLDERVAVKLLRSEHEESSEASIRFLREARAAVKIKSEHVARVSDVGTLDSGAPYMVMELLQGKDLGRAVTEAGRLPIDDAVDFAIQACEALAEAHGYGIVHRDVKPANLFLSTRPDGQPIVKVLDFGISKFMGAVEDLTRTTTAIGSALYMSPEQMRQTRSVDHRTDIYALGVTLYELIAGKAPFQAETLPQLCAEVLMGTPTPLTAFRPEAPLALGRALEKAYARDREHRYASVAELVAALAPFAPARSLPTIERIARLGALSASKPTERPKTAPVVATVPSSGTTGKGTDILPAEVATGSATSSRPLVSAVEAGRSTDAAVSSSPPPVPPTSNTRSLVAGAAGVTVLISVLVMVALRRPAPPPGAAIGAQGASSLPAARVEGPEKASAALPIAEHTAAPTPTLVPAPVAITAASPVPFPKRAPTAPSASAPPPRAPSPPPKPKIDVYETAQ